METTSAVATIKSMDHHLYEDRYRILGGDVPLVRKAGRGQIFAVMDGVGGAPRGMEAAQHIADVLTGFFTDPSVPPSAAGIETLVRRASDTIHTWGLMEGGDRPMGAAACTAAWPMACAAALRAPLAAKNDVLSVLPAPLDEEVLRARLEACDAAAIVKVGRHIAKVRRVLGDLGLEARARYIERASLAAERILPLAEAEDPAPYFSMILVHRRGEAWV